MSARSTYSLTAVLDAPVSGSDDDDAPDMIVRDVKVFRTGTFKNSRGVKGTWTSDLLAQAVQNFHDLREQNIFPDVPVRLDHTQSIKDVVGYFHNLRFDETFLRADLLFTNRAAYEQYKTGHLRSRSLEIGEYETNEGEKYHPVVSGLAFVDIPAVEGLHRQPNGEHNMSTDTKDETTKGQSDTSTSTDDKSTDKKDEDKDKTSVTASGTGQTQATPSPEGGDHGRVISPQTFKINGAESIDPVAVQAHIDALETFRNTTRTDLRTGFVIDLAARNVVTNPQAEQMKAFVLTLSDEQFATYRATYEGAPSVNLLAKHDTTSTGSAAVDQADEIAIHQETIQQFKRMNRPEEFIKNSEAWKRLEVLQAAK